MNYEKEINDLKRQVKQLNESVHAMGKNNVGQVSKLDDTSNKVTDLTPYTETKTAYIEDAYCVFENVPQGLVSVYVNGASHYNYDVFDHRISVKGLPLEEVTEVTISIQ